MQTGAGPRAPLSHSLGIPWGQGLRLLLYASLPSQTQGSVPGDSEPSSEKGKKRLSGFLNSGTVDILGWIFDSVLLGAVLCMVEYLAASPDSIY